MGTTPTRNATEVKFNNLYDVASLTKILATLPLLMELIDSGVIGLDSTLGDLLPSYKNTNKETITVQEMLSHFAQLKAMDSILCINFRFGHSKAKP